MAGTYYEPTTRTILLHYYWRAPLQGAWSSIRSRRVAMAKTGGFAQHAPGFELGAAERANRKWEHTCEPEG